HRVKHLAACVRQAEGHVGDAQARPGAGQLLLDETDGLNGFDAGADIVLVAGADRKDQRVEDDVLRLDAVLAGQQPVGALGDGRFALAGYGLGLLLVLVDAHDDERGSVAPGLPDHRLESLRILAVFQVDRVDDGLALGAFEGFFDNPMIGRIDHQRRLDLLYFDFQEPDDVRQLVAVRILEIDVDHLRSAAHLRPSDLGGFLELALGDQALELAAAEYVGALAHDDRARFIV